MSTRAAAAPLRALDVARALAATGPTAGLERLLAVLSRDDAEAVGSWRLLLHGGLAPLAAHEFAKHDLLAGATPRLREALQSALDVNALRNAVLRRAAVAASRALAESGLTPLWVKGIWLAHAVYPQPALRTMADIDLIVPIGQRAAARRVLEQLGYAAADTGPMDGAAAWTDTLALPAALPGGGRHIEIDLHDRIHLSETREWPVSRIWHNASRTRVGGVDVWTPSRESGLLYLAVHLFKHGFDLRHALVAVADAAALLRAADGALDVDWLEQHLGEPREATALYMLLAQLGAPPTSAAQDLCARLGQQLHVRGLRAHADTLLASAERLTLTTATDFSLFEIGEQASLSRALAGALAGVRRWHRRVRTPGMARPAAARRWPQLLGRANWRFAYTTFVAGRLNARLDDEQT